MQPGTAPITDDVSPALEISRLSSDRDECLAVALHSASLLFRNCVYPLRAAQERIATANSETTCESFARQKVENNPFVANVLLQRNLLVSGPIFMDSSNCYSTAGTCDASACRQAPKPEPARKLRSAAVKGVRSNVCMCADSLVCPILTDSPADSFTKTIHFPLDWQAQLDLDSARRPHPSDAHRMGQDRYRTRIIPSIPLYYAVSGLFLLLLAPFPILTFLARPPIWTARFLGIAILHNLPDHRLFGITLDVAKRFGLAAPKRNGPSSTNSRRCSEPFLGSCASIK